jgi:hypothetical protein
VDNTLPEINTRHELPVILKGGPGNKRLHNQDGNHFAQKTFSPETTQTVKYPSLHSQRHGSLALPSKRGQKPLAAVVMSPVHSNALMIEGISNLREAEPVLENNEWVEVINYQRELDEEKIQKEKLDKDRQKIQVKISLEQQLADKKARLQKEREAQKQFELSLLQDIKDKELLDLKKKSEHMGKAYQAKALKEQQLQEAMQRRQH